MSDATEARETPAPFEVRIQQFRWETEETMYVFALKIAESTIVDHHTSSTILFCLHNI